MGDYLFLICTTHRPCCVIPYSHRSSRRGCPRHLVLVGWEEEDIFILSQVVGVWGALGWNIVVGSNRLDLPPLTLILFRVVVWIRPSIHRFIVWCSVAGLRSWGFFLEQGRSMSCRLPQIFLHNRWLQSFYFCGGPDPACSPQYCIYF